MGGVPLSTIDAVGMVIALPNARMKGGAGPEHECIVVERTPELIVTGSTFSVSMPPVPFPPPSSGPSLRVVVGPVSRNCPRCLVPG